eukprot:gene4538-20389_t
MSLWGATPATSAPAAGGFGGFPATTAPAAAPFGAPAPPALALPGAAVAGSIACAPPHIESVIRTRPHHDQRRWDIYGRNEDSGEWGRDRVLGLLNQTQLRLGKGHEIRGFWSIDHVPPKPKEDMVALTKIPQGYAQLRDWLTVAAPVFDNKLGKDWGSLPGAVDGDGVVDEKLNAVKKLKILQDVSALFKIIFEREGDVKIRVDTHITDTAKHGLKVSFKVPPKGDSGLFHKGDEVIRYIAAWAKDHETEAQCTDQKMKDGPCFTAQLGEAESVGAAAGAIPGVAAAATATSMLGTKKQSGEFKFLSFVAGDIEVDKKKAYPGFDPKLIQEWDRKERELNIGKAADEPKLRKVPVFGYTDLLKHADELSLEEVDVANEIKMCRSELNELEKKQKMLELKMKEGRDGVARLKQMALENFAKMVPTHTSNADFEHRISDLKPKLDKVVKLHSKVRMQVDELRVGTQARDTHMASIGHLKQEQEQEHELVRHLEVQQKGIENLKKQLLLSNNVLQRLQGK